MNYSLNTIVDRVLTCRYAHLYFIRLDGKSNGLSPQVFFIFHMSMSVRSYIYILPYLHKILKWNYAGVYRICFSFTKIQYAPAYLQISSRALVYVKKQDIF